MARVVVFDSGIGGKTISDGIAKAFPQIEVIHTMDRDNIPYGAKSDETIVRLATQFCQEQFAKYKPDLLVVACNTASTVALAAIREAVSCPVVGVVPAIKPAAVLSKSKIIGLLATPATIKQSYVDRLVQEFAQGCEVRRLGSSRLVEIAEDKYAGKPVDVEEVHREIAALFVPGMDVVVLGCTHFPHLLDELKQSSPWNVKWVDSTQAIVERVRSLLKL